MLQEEDNNNTDSTSVPDAINTCLNGVKIKTNGNLHFLSLQKTIWTLLNSHWQSKFMQETRKRKIRREKGPKKQREQKKNLFITPI